MVLRRIALPGANDVVRFSEDSIAMLAIECLEDCPVVNTPLEQLSDLFPDLTATVAGDLAQTASLIVPHSSDQLITGDIAYVICDRDHVRQNPWVCSGMKSRRRPASLIVRRRQYRLFCRQDNRRAPAPHQGEDHRV